MTVSWQAGSSGIMGLMLGGPAPPEWARYGISAFQARLWGLLCVRPAEAAGLTSAGIDPVDSIEQWWRAGIPLDEVAAWLGAGLTVQEALEQRAAGVTVEQAEAFRALQGMGR